MGDSDDSYDFSRLEYFVENLRNGDELVMGNRFKGGFLPGASPWLNRYIGNPVLSGIGVLFFKCPAGDFHCGLGGFSKEAYQNPEIVRTAPHNQVITQLRAEALEDPEKWAMTWRAYKRKHKLNSLNLE